MCYEVEPNKWNLYDWSGKQLNDSVPIETFFLTKEKERNQLLEKLGDSETIVAEEILSANSFRQFVKAVLLHLYNIDNFECFFDKLKRYTQSDINYRWVTEGSNIYFRADSISESGFWESEFVVDGTSWYLNNAPKSEGFAVFASFINQYYPEFYAEKRGTQFFLYCAPRPYASKDSRQVIYYGAPGTGKSNEVKRITNEKAKKRTIRTTFHPDTDYSSFVGCYKPKMVGDRIEYRFVPQAFARAYVNAWKDLSKPYYLVIEEINRGNCAQIFGDIFQLLDREITGESTYSIQPDTDLQAYIQSELSEIPNIPFEIAHGDEMSLPANFYIYATMNTSDQSLFPIDSAFKRRWDMRYTAIKSGEKDHILIVNDIQFSWSSFIEKINKEIFRLTKSEDKQLGYWFIKPDDNGIINWELFVSKALFYIWNDVVKDYVVMENEKSPFNKRFAFTTFFNANGEAQAPHVVDFLETLEVKHKPASTNYLNYLNNVDGSSDAEYVSEPANEYFSEGTTNNENATGARDTTKYQINGSGKIPKKYLAYELIKQYIADRPDASAFDVVKAWKSLGDLVPHFIELQEEYDQRPDKKDRMESIVCKGENIYVSTNGWGGKAKMQELISAVESKDWGLHITEYQE